LRTVSLHKTNSTRTKGFGLIELLVAAVLLTVFLLHIFGLFPSAYKAMAHVKTTVIAGELAKQEMERLVSALENDHDWENFFTKVPNEWTYVSFGTTSGYTKEYNRPLISTINDIKTTTVFYVIPRVEDYNYQGENIGKKITLLVEYEFGANEAGAKRKTGAEIRTIVTKNNFNQAGSL
jgi:type II secretory pathway pseudopilin PulG